MPKVARSGYVRIASVETCDVEDHHGRRVAMTWNLSVRGLYLVIDPLPELDERIRLSSRLSGTPEPKNPAAPNVFRRTRHPRT